MQQQIQHPYIISDKRICKGSPVIARTRTRIVDIVIEYEYLGYTVDEIINAHPYLTMSQVHDALSFYYENREKLDNEIKLRKELIAEIRKKLTV